MPRPYRRRADRAKIMTVIRVALVDDHYAVRLGLDAQPGMTPVGAAACGADVKPLLSRTAPEAIEPEDHAILGMLVHGLHHAEICHTLPLEAADPRARRARMLAALRAPAAA
jgi:hypothetical protein